jgi:glyoxylase-like metal-dependent hydrolase (beta-lactamase superfamily II)
MVTIRTVLAPNPSRYTGPGTNTYVLVDRDECLVVDPGPVIDDHRVAIREAVNDLQPVGVLVTHTHSDHAPLANPLATELDVPAYGWAPGPDFDPDRRVGDGARIRFGRAAAEVIHTPGHAEDHVCFAVDDLLFTGDHIMGGSTVVVSDLADYLASLRKVQGTDWARIYPGHGPEIDNPAATISEYLEHRLDRERQILDAMERGARSVGSIVEIVYADVDSELHPVAAHSVAAHLTKLQRDGLVTYAARKYAHGEQGLWDEPVAWTPSHA